MHIASLHSGVKQGRGSLKDYEEGLQQAMALQSQVVEAVRGDHPDLVAAHKQAAAEMQAELAGLYASQHKLDLVRLCPSSLRVYGVLCVCVCLCTYQCLCLSVCLSVGLSLYSGLSVCLSLVASACLLVEVRPLSTWT